MICCYNSSGDSSWPTRHGLSTWMFAWKRYEERPYWKACQWWNAIQRDWNETHLKWIPGYFILTRWFCQGESNAASDILILIFSIENNQWIFKIIHWLFSIEKLSVPNVQWLIKRTRSVWSRFSHGQKSRSVTTWRHSLDQVTSDGNCTKRLDRFRKTTLQRRWRWRDHGYLIMLSLYFDSIQWNFAISIIESGLLCIFLPKLSLVYSFPQWNKTLIVPLRRLRPRAR